MSSETHSRNDSEDSARDSQRVCLGVVVGSHGVRGILRVKAFTEVPTDVGAYGPVEDESGRRRFDIKVHGEHKGTVLASLEGVADRDQALALKGVRLYVDRAALPRVEEEETFYHADLVGLPVEDTHGQPLGRVMAVLNFGAGDILEIEDGEGGSILLPFTKEIVPLVDVKAGRIVADPPEETPEP